MTTCCVINVSTAVNTKTRALVVCDVHLGSAQPKHVSVSKLAVYGFDETDNETLGQQTIF